MLRITGTFIAARAQKTRNGESKKRSLGMVRTSTNCCACASRAARCRLQCPSDLHPRLLQLKGAREVHYRRVSGVHAFRSIRRDDAGMEVLRLFVPGVYEVLPAISDDPARREVLRVRASHPMHGETCRTFTDHTSGRASEGRFLLLCTCVGGVIDELLFFSLPCFPYF